ncbi:hypothetical protein B0H14DRAFT_3709367 [Mycena olivaceomarginata]|nr:hypothetical protein B0H14DRAFT_3709367 [Mycena olivaceomarginata]
MSGSSRNSSHSPASRAPSPPSSLAGTPTSREPRTRPSSRAVSPELSYSQVVNPAPLGGSGSVARTPGSSAEHSLPPLNREVDFDAPDSDVNAGHPWTPVSRKTARSHRERSTSPTNGSLNSQKNASGVTSTVELATREMSEAELIAMARRFEALARDARAAARQRSVLSDNKVPDQENLPSPKTLIDLDTEISVVPEIKPQVDDIPVSPVIPSGEGTSRPKDKGVDPRNWGNLDFAKEFSDTELQAQKDALENFEEIKHVRIKREELPTPPGFFDDLREARPDAFVPKEPSRKRGSEGSGQTDSVETAKSAKKNSTPRQSGDFKPKKKPVLNQAENVVKNSILNNMHQDESKRSSSRKLSGQPAMRAAAGTFRWFL